MISDFLSYKEQNKYLRTSFESVKKNYSSKRQSEESNFISRNTNFTSEINKLKNIKTQNINEKKYKFLLNAYNQIKVGKYDTVEDIMKKYLKDIKNFDEKEENKIMKYYDYKNLRNNLYELNLKISEEKTIRNSEKIYSNNHILKRINPILNTMREKEINIDRLEKIYTNGINKYT